jgi:uncharacterized protein YgiM (DUF1202 family)
MSASIRSFAALAARLVPLALVATLLLIGAVGPLQAAGPAQADCQAMHTVQRGQTLMKIGLQYGMTWDRIARANNLPDPNKIRVGQVLCIPAAGKPAPEVVLVQPTDVQYILMHTDLNLRAGPGLEFTVISKLFAGQIAKVTGISANGQWWRVMCPDDTIGNCWVSASPRYTEPTTPPGTAPNLAAAVSVASLDLRDGPSPNHAVIAKLAQGQALTLLGRTADSTWVKVRAAGKGEGWIPAVVTVILPGSESGTSTTPFQASVSVSSLPVVTASNNPAQARVSLNATSVRIGSPVYVTLENFPANRDVSAVLTSRLVPNGYVVATGRTDTNGYAQLFFRMPATWASGAAISEAALSLAVGTTDGAVLLWNGLRYTAN